MQEEEHVFYLRPATGYEGCARCDCGEGLADDSPVFFELRFAVYIHFPCNLFVSMVLRYEGHLHSPAFTYTRPELKQKAFRGRGRGRPRPRYSRKFMV